jgi:aryl-alcohol dehydrogenase-like predicted oxidoreductase
MELRGAPRARDITEAQAETILNKVLDAGINYIDTSIDYGLSEERIGRYISNRRAEYYLASKCGCLVGAPPAPRENPTPPLDSFGLGELAIQYRGVEPVERDPRYC